MFQLPTFGNSNSTFVWKRSCPVSTSLSLPRQSWASFYCCSATALHYTTSHNTNENGALECVLRRATCIRMAFAALIFCFFLLSFRQFHSAWNHYNGNWQSFSWPFCLFCISAVKFDLDFDWPKNRWSRRSSMIDRGNLCKFAKKNISCQWFVSTHFDWIQMYGNGEGVRNVSPNESCEMSCCVTVAFCENSNPVPFHSVQVMVAWIHCEKKKID